VHLVGFTEKKFVAMHGHMNVIKSKCISIIYAPRSSNFIKQQF